MEKHSEKNNILESKFTEFRKEWKDKMEDLIQKLRKFEDMTDVQVLQLSYRHSMVDYVTDLHRILVKSKTLYETFKSESFIKIKTKNQFKLNGTETNNMVISEIRPIKERIEIIEYQISYGEETIKTLDTLGYAIKNIIEKHKFEFGE